MKKKNLIYSILIVALMLPLQLIGQGGPTAVVTPSPLQVSGDSVRFTAKITVPADKVFKKEGSYVLKAELGDKRFPEIVIPYSQLQNAADNGINITVSSSILFDEDMIGNDLEIEHEYRYGNKKKEFADMDDLAECCSTMGMLFFMNSQYELKKYEYTEGSSVPLKIVAQLNFPLDISKFSPDQYREKVKVIGEYLKTYPDAKITVRGYASPEGPLARNQQLATDRAEAARNWLTSKLKEAGYSKQLTGKNINIEITTEDWQGFLKKLDESNISQAKKDSIRTIVTAGLTPAETERRVMAVVGGKDAVESLLAPLRRSTVVVFSEKAVRPGYSVDQIDSITTAYAEGNVPATSLVDIYTKEEYLQAVQQTNAKEGKMSLVAAYYKNNPGDVRIYSDLGVMTVVDQSRLDAIGGDDALVGVGFDRDMVDIDSEVDIDDDKVKIKYKYKEEDVDDGIDVKIKYKADLDQAEGLFIKAIEATPNDAVVLNNLAAVSLARGDFSSAKSYLDKASASSISRGGHYNWGLYYAGIGNMKKAVEHFNKAGDIPGSGYNRGLAKLLTGDAAGAKADLQRYVSRFPDHAIAHYVLAVAGARTNDMNLMTTELKKAIALNKKLSDIAQEDLEFSAYWDNDSWKAAADDDPKD